MHFRYVFLLAALLSINPLAATSELEEIVVTAGFRDVGILNATGSQSVMLAEQMRSRGSGHLEDTLQAIPNVSFSSGGARARFIQIRGIGELEQFVDPKHFPSVGVLVDGIELIGVGSAANLLDVEQVEVLRGPQGTRFGASSLAGMVNVRARQPSEEFQGHLEAGYGNFDTWFVEAAAGGSISDSLQARIAVRQAESDGYIDNEFLDRDDTDGHDELTARGKLRWLASDTLSFDLTLAWFDLDNGYDAFTLDNSRNSLADEPGSDEQEMLALSGSANWQLSDEIELQALFSVTDSEELYAFDEDWVFSGFCDGVRCPPAFEFSSTDSIERDRDAYSVDLRASGAHERWQWVLGVYTQQREEDLSRQRFGLFTSTYETQRYAVYGQISHDLTDRLSLTGGVRIEHFSDDYDDSNATRTANNETYWSGELTALWAASDEVNVYATLARGAKPGGTNTEASSVSPFMQARFQDFLNPRLRFSRETLFSKEVGVKARFMDERLGLRAAVFHMDRDDAQLESWMWDAVNFIWVGILDNASSAENYGVELELDFAVNERLSFNAAIGWLETNVDSLTVFDLDADAFERLEGRDQTKAPQWQYHFGAELDLIESLTANVELEGRSSSFYGYYHDGKLESFAVVNAALSWRHDSLTVRAWARNLFNKKYPVHGLFFANDARDGFSVNRTYFQFGEPRVYGVSATWEF